MQEVSLQDLYWVAGLLEGEGAFLLEKQRRGGYRYPLIVLAMCDRDIIDRAKLILGDHLSVMIIKVPPPRKTYYRIRIRSAKALAWMHLLYPILGDRRQEKIRYIRDNMTCQNLFDPVEVIPSI